MVVYSVLGKEGVFTFATKREARKFWRDTWGEDPDRDLVDITRHELKGKAACVAYCNNINNAEE